ncbi:MAG: site-2 protease family protein [Anaerolineales bacterium]|nr:site-2 protease family protein [Anaerolineales bacterium]
MDTYPETEVLTALVSRVFRIESWTLGDTQKKFIVRYTGRLSMEDSISAYDHLAGALKPYHITPFFRETGDGEQEVILTPNAPEAKPNPRIRINLILLVLTILSVMLAGVPPEQSPDGYWWSQLSRILEGWPFAVSLMSILLAHEFGHYLVSRYYDNNATLPFFIPLPFISPFGTMGAVIHMKERLKNRRVLFDIGAAGPLAGMIVAIPILFYGLSLSKVGPIETPMPGFTIMLEGNSLFYLFAKYLTFGKLLPQPMEYGGISPLLYWVKYFFTGLPLPIGGVDVQIHSVAFAGWAGLLVTALNLIPVGTLDGGHVVYALFGEKARKAFPFIMAALVALGFLFTGWWLWAGLLYFFGRVHAEPHDQITRLDPARKLVAVVVVIIFILTFTPVPLIIIGA